MGRFGKPLPFKDCNVVAGCTNDVYYMCTQGHKFDTGRQCEDVPFVARCADGTVFGLADGHCGSACAQHIAQFFENVFSAQTSSVQDVGAVHFTASLCRHCQTSSCSEHGARSFLHHPVHCEPT